MKYGPDTHDDTVRDNDDIDAKMGLDYCPTQAGHDRSHVPKASVIYAWLHAVQHSLSRRHPLSLSTRVRQGGEDGFICETSGPDASVGTLTPVTTKSVISE